MDTAVRNALESCIARYVASKPEMFIQASRQREETAAFPLVTLLASVAEDNVKRLEDIIGNSLARTQRRAAQEGLGRSTMNDFANLSGVPNRMRAFCDDINKALNGGCFLSALATALIIPDTMGAVAYPELISKNNRRRIGEQYALWFDKYAAPRFTFEAFHDSRPAIPEKPEMVQPVSGAWIWSLRCSLLHQASTEFTPKEPIPGLSQYPVVNLKLTCNSCSGLSRRQSFDEHGIVYTTVDVSVDVKDLCLAIVDGVRITYKAYGPYRDDGLLLDILDVPAALALFSNRPF